MTDLESTMREWLSDPDPLRRAHARMRIDAGFDAVAEPTATAAPNVYRAAVECPHRECGVGCELTRCLAGKGDRDGGSHTTLLHCVECVRGS